MKIPTESRFSDQNIDALAKEQAAKHCDEPRIASRPSWMPPINEVDALAADMSACRADNGDLAVMLYETGLRAMRHGELPTLATDAGEDLVALDAGPTLAAWIDEIGQHGVNAFTHGHPSESHSLLAIAAALTTVRKRLERIEEAHDVALSAAKELE